MQIYKLKIRKKIIFNFYVYLCKTVIQMKKTIKNKTIALRVEGVMYEKLLEISLKKSKEEKRNVGVSDIIRTIIEKEMK